MSAFLANKAERSGTKRTYDHDVALQSATSLFRPRSLPLPSPRPAWCRDRCCRVIAADLAFPSPKNRTCSLSPSPSCAAGRSRKSASRRENGGSRGFFARLMADVCSRAASCATGNSVPPWFPRHEREAGKIACRGSTIRGKTERERRREETGKGQGETSETRGMRRCVCLSLSLSLSLSPLFFFFLQSIRRRSRVRLPSRHQVGQT